MAKRVSPAALTALEEALTSLFWYKNDLKKFLVRCLGPHASLLSGTDWRNDYKRDVVSRVVHTLSADQDRYSDVLIGLVVEIVAFEDFPHLQQVEDAERKIAQAKSAVGNLRKLAAGYLVGTKEKEEIERRRNADAARVAKATATQKRLAEICDEFRTSFTLPDQKRGYALERILYDVFAAFDMDPKASFKIEGEQVDGGFTFEGTDFIVEAKWTNSPAARDDVDVFAAKVDRKLDNTLGLLISINGFTQTALTKGGSGRTKIIAMTGEDLMAVLDDRISLPDLLVRKRRHGAQTGQLFLPVSAILVQK